MNKAEILIHVNNTLHEALVQLNKNPLLLTLLVHDSDNKILGSITDGDIRRAFIKGHNQGSFLKDILHENFIYLIKGKIEHEKIKLIKSKRIRVVPILYEDFTLFDIINFDEVKSILPIDAVIMAGGKGTRLLPLTANTPKPLLKIQEKPIIDYNIDLLRSFGINHVSVSVNHLKEQIISHFEDNNKANLKINFISEEEPLGTIGALKIMNNFHHDYVLVMNSDLLTNINLEKMFNLLISSDAEMAVATTEYTVQIPYGVIETSESEITGLKEKPKYIYYSNAGIYILNKNLINSIPENKVFNATDLIESIIVRKGKVVHFPIKGYWLDIGKHVDFERAQKDIAAGVL